MNNALYCSPYVVVQQAQMRPFIKIVFFAVLLSLVLVPFRLKWLGIQYSVFFGILLFFILSVFSFRRYSSKLPSYVIFFALILGECLLFVNIIYGFFYGHLWFVPQLFAQTIAIILGTIYFSVKNSVRFLPPVLTVVFAVFMFVAGCSYWLHFINFGSLTGSVQTIKLPVEIKGTDQHGRRIGRDDLTGKVVVLDFWTTTCGVCFEKFPKLQNFYDKYRTASDVSIIALNKPLDEDQGNPFPAIEAEGYTFTTLLPDDEYLPEKLGVSVYPTTIIVDREGNLVYRGDLENGLRMAENLIAAN